MRRFAVGAAEVGAGRPLLVAGPCVVEGRGMLADTAGFLAGLAREIGWPLVFKASYRKDNRLSPDSFSGLGDEKALALLADAGREAGLPLLTDVHRPEEVAAAAAVVDCLQIPAFLCRQTSLLAAAGAAGRAVNLKKGQFLAAADLAFSAEKLARAGCDRVLLTERGSSWGERDLVVDFRSFPRLAAAGWPVLFDLTHSQQRPGAGGGASGGTRDYARVLARAALAAGADGLFLEVHPDPARAKSDSATQLGFDAAGALLRELARLHAAMEAGDALP
ncbi:MAG: 3-deoxy-8-phosphooctulonate synthase [Candidatus Krumholzibacteriota bacterium]|nr:3-deoxy-8-phosphooctulonate synthase [Candidatus Krumholzibacteriota bacterium]